MVQAFPNTSDDNLDKKVHNLNGTNDGESCEESHGTTNGGELGLKVCFFIFCDSIKGGGHKVDLHKVEFCLFLGT